MPATMPTPTSTSHRPRRHKHNLQSATIWLVALTLLLSALSGTTVPVSASSRGSPDTLELRRIANESLLWGTYRPQLYHGIRARLPKSLMTGLMWHGLNDYPSHREIRHTCEQSDSLTSYAYTHHDGRTYSSQDLVDGKNNAKITTKFLKSEQGDGSDGCDGDGWVVRVRGEVIDPGKISRTSLIYHFGLEGLGELRLESEVDEEDIEGDVVLIGNSVELGDFRIRIVDHPDSARDLRARHHADFADSTTKTTFAGAAIPDGDVWRVKDMVNQAIIQKAGSIMQRYGPENPPDPAYLFRLNNVIQPGANVFAFQKVGIGADVSGGGPWGFDVFFEKIDGSSVNWDYDTLSQAFSAKSAAYDKKFASAFDLPEEYSSDEYVRFAQEMTASMIGGIGYFQGESIVDRSFKQSYDDDEEEEDDEDEDEDDDADNKPVVTKPKGPVMVGPTELFTATPSRSFFPRGFYWDEGFHLAIIADWDNDIALDILKSWFDLVDEDGWVAREQILGSEARSKVPTEFQTQYPSYANPPTLVLALTKYIAKLKAQTDTNILDSQLGFNSDVQLKVTDDIADAHLNNPDLAESYLRSIYPALRRHYLWFRRTQKGQLREWHRRPRSKTEAYRWRGRTEEHVLTSGLDDYPRAKPPHSGELHVDLMSWVGFFARTMGEVAEYLDEADDLKEYRKHERGVLANLDELHWSEQDKAYCDVTVDEDDESVHVCHKGYVTLFPFFLQHIPSDSPHLKDILDLMRSPAHLWSPYGLRSLSMSDPNFGQGENYWKGPIWIQMNWLALKALSDKYTKEPGPYQQLATEIYKELRANVVENVFKEWKRTGYLWEQYDARNGEGRRSHPFTGWTALVVMIMTERY